MMLLRKKLRADIAKVFQALAALLPAVLMAIALLAAPSRADVEPAAERTQEGPLVVLDTVGFWRMHHTLEAPLIDLPDGLAPVMIKQKWMLAGTGQPADKWMAPDFDDGKWLRAPARMAGRTPFLSQLCLRGYFNVSDPAAVGKLLLDVEYRGGIIVYLNGHEISRANIQKSTAGQARPIAEPYPTEAFVPSKGWGSRDRRAGDSETQELADLRNRHLRSLQLPRDRLVKGRNVLAIELVRAPYDAILDAKKRAWARSQMYEMDFNTCELKSLRLSADSPGGIEPNAVRQPGVQVWNTNLLAADFDLDFGGQAEPLRPLQIVGCRGGSFSAKLAIGSTEPLRGPKATVSDLRSGKDGFIPAQRISVRYGLPGSAERGAYFGRGMDGYFGITRDDTRYPRPPTMLGALADEAPAEVPVYTSKEGRADLKLPGQPEPVFGAVLPIWVTVDVPHDAEAGNYSGKLTVELDGKTLTTVPVELRVADYRLPETAGASTWVELIQSPDTLAIEYELDMWSDEHFKLIERSLKFLGQVGCDSIYLPVIAQTNLGNAESMVRWIPRPDGSYDFDFTIMDRYLEAALKQMGRPQVVCFPVWEIYMGDATGYKDEYSHNERLVEARSPFAGKGPLVTILDPETGETRTDHIPIFTEPRMKAVWKKLFAELRQRMGKHKLEEAMMLGQMSDHWPSRQENEFFDEVSGKLPWVSHSHVGIPESGKYSYGSGGVPGGRRTMDLSYMKVGYFSAVFNDNMADNDPPLGTHMGWRNENINAYQPRYEAEQPSSRWRHMVELNITGHQRGMARGGADFWVVLRNRHGQRSGRIHSRYIHSAWRNLDIVWNLLEPGPKGPVATHHFEAFREGIQEAEARIAIERALADDASRAKLGKDLAERCEQFLTARTQLMLKAVTHLHLRNGAHLDSTLGPLVRQGAMSGHTWFVGSNWQDRTLMLFNLAGEVQAKLGKK